MTRRPFVFAGCVCLLGATAIASCIPDDACSGEECSAAVLCEGTRCGLENHGEVRAPDWREGIPGDAEEGTRWVAVVDETVRAGSRGIAGDIGPALAVDDLGQPHVVFTHRGDAGFIVGRALRGSTGVWSEDRAIGSSSYLAYAIGAPGAVRIAAPTSDQARSIIWEEAPDWQPKTELDHLVGFAGVDAAGFAHLVGLGSDRDVVFSSETEDGWVTQVLYDSDTYHPSFVAAVSSAGVVAIATADRPAGEVLFVDSTGRREVIERAEPSMYGTEVSRLVFTDEGTPVAAVRIADRALAPDGDVIRLYRQGEVDWSHEELALDPDPPAADACEDDAAACAFDTVRHRVLQLVPTDDGAIPIIERLAIEARYERECVELGFVGDSCAPVCVDEDGPQGPWQTWASERPVATPELLVEGMLVSLDAPLPERHELAARLDAAGRLHLAFYQLAGESWEDGDDVRYLRLERR